MENESKCFTNVSIIFSKILVDHDLRKQIKILLKPFLFSIRVFNLIKLIAILQVKAGKTEIKESYVSIT